MKSLRELEMDLPGVAKYNANVLRIRRGTGLSATTKLYTAEFHRQCEATMPQFLKDAFAKRPHHRAKTLERRTQARHKLAETLVAWRKHSPAAARAILTGFRASEDTFNYNVATAYDFYMARRHNLPVDEEEVPIIPQELKSRSWKYAYALVSRRVAQQIRKEVGRGNREVGAPPSLGLIEITVRKASKYPLGI